MEEDARNRDYVRQCGGIAALVGLLAPGGAAGVHHEAILALDCLCLDSSKNQERVREGGGVAALVGLLAPGSSADVLIYRVRVYRVG